MRCQTSSLDGGSLAGVDLVDLGARSGLLWRSNDVTLVGLGSVDEIEVDRFESADTVASALAARTSAAPSVAGVGPVAFTALPFEPTRGGQVQIPSIVIVATNGNRFVTHPTEMSLPEVEREVRALLSATARVAPTEVELILERSADRWRDDVVRVARDAIVSSSLQKAVLARQLTLHADSDFDTAAIVRDLSVRFAHANLFSIDGFIGASPELLVSRSGRTVRAHPLAGTAARLADPAGDAEQVDGLLASGKDRTEHQITIDWLLTELLPFCSYVDAEPEPSIVTLANVHHLGTLVEGVLSSPPASILDLVTAVHPTPAVGGDPKDDALELIADLEGFDRHRYAGPAGWVDAQGNGEFAVSVRTAQVNGPIATIAAGVGVVAQSDPDDELRETQAKLRAMLGSFLRPTPALDDGDWVARMKVKATALTHEAAVRGSSKA